MLPQSYCWRLPVTPPRGLSVAPSSLPAEPFPSTWRDRQSLSPIASRNELGHLGQVTLTCLSLGFLACQWVPGRMKRVNSHGTLGRRLEPAGSPASRWHQNPGYVDALPRSSCCVSVSGNEGVTTLCRGFGSDAVCVDGGIDATLQTEIRDPLKRVRAVEMDYPFQGQIRPSPLRHRRRCQGLQGQPSSIRTLFGNV